MPGDGGGQGHLGGDRLADGTQHVVVGHVDKGRALEVIVVDGVESDVDSPRISGDSVGMSLDCDAISRIELSDLRTSPDLGDAGCYVNGSDDHPYVDTADHLAGALPRATQLTIPGADHLTALTHPELRSAVIDFLARPRS